MAIPGNTPTHQAISIQAFPLFSIIPQEGTSGSTPIPRKLRAASDKIAKASDKVTCTRIGERILGRICLTIIVLSLTPMDLAASTYRESFTESTAPLVILAKIGVYTIPIAIIILFRLGPKIDIIKRANSTSGNANMISKIREITPSVSFPKYPAATPKNTPATVAMVTDTRETLREILAP